MGSVDGTEDSSEKGELAFLPERTCAICHQDQNPIAGSENELMAITGASGGIIGSAQTDVTNPYQTIPCGCVFCFVCIAKRLEGEDGEGWICLRCGTLVKECRPWNGDVIEKVFTPTTQKTVDLSDEEDKQPDKIKERCITKDHGSMHDAGFNDKGNTVDPVLSNENFGSQEWAQQGSDESKSH